MKAERIALLCQLGDLERDMKAEGDPVSHPTAHAALMSFVRKRGRVRNQDVMAEFGIRAASASGMLQRAVAAGLLKVTASGLGHRTYALNIEDDLAEAASPVTTQRVTRE